MTRCDKLISDLTTYSRKEIKELISERKVTVNGAVVTAPDIKIPEDSRISVCGKDVSGRGFAYIVMNKPGGIISASEDKKAKTVIDLVPESLKRKDLFPAGRLDKDTTGLMIITNDGDFAHRILSPSRHVPKSYRVTIDVPVTAEMKEGFENGVSLNDGVTRPAEITDTDGNSCTVLLREGRYHQIKRMFGCYGAKVMKLHRLTMGGLSLPGDLAPGECRELTNEEIELIEGKEL